MAGAVWLPLVAFHALTLIAKAKPYEPPTGEKMANVRGRSLLEVWMFFAGFSRRSDECRERSYQSAAAITLYVRRVSHCDGCVSRARRQTDQICSKAVERCNYDTIHSLNGLYSSSPSTFQLVQRWPNRGLGPIGASTCSPGGRTGGMRRKRQPGRLFSGFGNAHNLSVSG